MADLPVFLTHHNQHSASPRMALWPDPLYSAGYRLWQMTGCTKEQFVRGWDRRNLVDGHLHKIWDSLTSRHVVVVGSEAATEISRLGIIPPGSWVYPKYKDGPAQWRLIPDPVDEANEYKDTSLRLQVRLLLSEWFYTYSGFTMEDTHAAMARRMADLASVPSVHTGKESVLNNGDTGRGG